MVSDFLQGTGKLHNETRTDLPPHLLNDDDDDRGIDLTGSDLTAEEEQAKSFW